MNVFVVIPGHNEEKHIYSVIQETKKYASNIVFVDDGSKDKTVNEAKKTGVTILKHLINLGKGAAIRTGAAYATAKGADAIIFMDSDGQHKPAHIPTLIRKLKGYDIIFTYRNFKSTSMPIIKKIGNLFLDSLLKKLFQIKIVDAQCGYKIMTTQTYRKLHLTSSDYTIESEIAAKTSSNKLKFKQVPIETVYIDKYKGTTAIDGINIAIKMLKWRVTK